MLTPIECFVTGSTVEGQAHSRHFNNESISDLDVMAPCGEIDKQDELINAALAPGFVYVKWNSNKLASLPAANLPNQNDQLCINGRKLKNSVINSPEAIYFRTSQPMCRLQMDTSDDSASIQTQVIMNRLSINEQVKNYIELLKDKSRKQRLELKENFLLVFNANNIMCEKLSINESMKQIALTQMKFTASAFNIAFSSDVKEKLNAMIDFFFKYKHMSDEKIYPKFLGRLSSFKPIESDIVVSLKLNFWPDDIQPFLNRFKTNCPLLYEKIKFTHMHIIPKWSKKTSEIMKEFEFRYSFSEIEIILAQSRSKNEQILNGIARNIYYIYSKKFKCDNKDKSLSSYFIKTTVLWLCEEKREIINSLTNLTDIGQLWINYTCELLKRRICLHYFIENINLLEKCSNDYLDNICECLININLNDQHSTLINDQSINVKLMNEYFKMMLELCKKCQIKNVIRMIDDYRDLVSKHFPRAVDNNFFSTMLSLAAFNGGKANNLRKLKKILLSNDDNNNNHLLDIPQSFGPKDYAEFLIGNVEGSVNLVNYIVTNEESMNNIRYICETKSLPLEKSIYELFKLASNQSLLYKTVHEDHLLLSIFTNKGRADNERLKNRTVMDYLPNGPQIESCTSMFTNETQKDTILSDDYEQYKLRVDEIYESLINEPEENQYLTLYDYMTMTETDTTTVTNDHNDEESISCCHLIWCIIHLLLFLMFNLRSIIIAPVEIFMGFKYKNNCLIQPKIPVYLIVDGIMTLISIFIGFFIWLIYRLFRNKSVRYLYVLWRIKRIINFFIFIWFIVGQIWIFSVKKSVQHVDQTAANYCQPKMYNVSFCILILDYIFWLIEIYCCDSKRKNESGTGFFNAIAFNSKQPTVKSVPRTNNTRKKTCTESQQMYRCHIPFRATNGMETFVTLDFPLTDSEITSGNSVSITRLEGTVPYIRNLRQNGIEWWKPSNGYLIPVTTTS